MPSIRDLLSPDAVRLDVSADDWRTAIRASGDLLVTSGVVTESYTEAMIASVEEHGPYIVIAPGFALAHARPDESVQRTGLSLVRLARPVAFGHESNDPVSLVMALAATDDAAHRDALVQIATVLADPAGRARLDGAKSADEVLAAFDAGDTDEPDAAQARSKSTAPAGPSDATAASGASAAATGVGRSSASTASGPSSDEPTVPSKHLILTVCGNGVGTSLFLKSTAEKVLSTWGWSPFLTIEATDTISAKGKAKDADLILTSGAIAQTLGDVGVPVQVIKNFTSTDEIDAALRRQYAI